jgi:epoxyqueuosine reductase
LLVNKEFGSAVRYCTVLTNAPLPPAQPITESQCGNCTKCVDACPAHAVFGKPWSQGMKREEFYDAFACQAYAKERGKQIGVEKTVCGICIAACPFTQKYLSKPDKK